MRLKPTAGGFKGISDDSSHRSADSCACQNGGGWQSLNLGRLQNGGTSMPWRRFGVPIAVIVVFFALGRITSLVVDWAWFSSIGYVGVFWTGFITKAALFVVVLAVSTFLL